MEPNTPVFENESQLEKYSKLSQAINSAFQKKDMGNQLKTAGAFIGSYWGIGTAGIAATGSAVAIPVALAAASMVAFTYYQSKKTKLNERESIELKNAESAVKNGVTYAPLPVEKGLSLKQKMTQAFSKLGQKIKTEYSDIFSESAIRVSEEEALRPPKPTMMERFSKMGSRIVKNSKEAVVALSDKLSQGIYDGLELADKKLNHIGNTVASNLDKAINENLYNAIQSVNGKIDRFAEFGGRIIQNTGGTIISLSDKLSQGIYDGLELADKKLNHIGNTVASKLDKALNKSLPDFSQSVTRKADNFSASMAKIDDKIYHGFENSIEFIGGKVEAFSEAAGHFIKDTGMTIVKLDEKLNEGLYNAIQSVHRQANGMRAAIIHTGDKINDRAYDAIQGLNSKIYRFAQAGGRVIEHSGAAITKLDEKLNKGLYNVIQSTDKKMSAIGDSVVKLDDKLNESLYNTIQSANQKIDRLAEFGGQIIKNSGSAITRLDHKLNEGLYNAVQSVDGKISLVNAALKQMRSNGKLSSMSAGRSSVDDAKNIEKMASAMADLRNAFGVAGETGGKMTAFGAKKLEESVASDIERVVVGLRRNGDHKAIFNDLSNHLDAISGYGYNLAEKGGLSYSETADRIKTIVDCATTLGAEPEMMWHAYHQAEDKLSENDFHEENDESPSKMIM